MAKSVVGPACPDCGTVLDQGLSIVGLCPHCLLELALEESPVPPGVAEDPDVMPTLPYPDATLSPGRILGGRYQIRALLGRGGMGEVWRAFDLKLRVDVALKALHQNLLDEARALETLRQEVRTAREVMSPNVCRVFDLVEIDRQELVSMEYIDGTTLQETLKTRSPLALDEAREIAAQFLAGLEAIHDAGLVHRDMKPENVMLTRSGRAVVMDFGIAKGLAEAGAGTVAGTPAYMAPEQARGEAVTARADVFSAGVVLAEMVAPDGVQDREARLEVWRGVQHEPPEVAESPWQAVVRRAVARVPEDRYSGAAALARALEEVTLRVAGAEDVQPYPGLASFTRDDAEYFFGRELEIEAMWKKLRRPHMLGLIGPSGAGKSSFIRAGLLPVLPTGWRAVITTPGSRPMSAFAQALADEVSGDPEAVRDLLRFDEPDVAVSLVSRWRQRHDQALVIVDQFEELFTQSSSVVQAGFADLLARLALEADVHVLLSMRDDFLGFCSQQESLAPVFSELTALKPLSGSAVRRALVQPAAKCGYRFEDDSLVDEMVAEVSDERGALPMLAFAAARLWEHRDREQGLLTRDAYEHIGGVVGALALHAEKTLEQIGTDRIPVVRELFRNLITAEGTRIARDREELLSVFSAAGEGVDSRAVAEILDTLVNARLLTSYEVVGGDEDTVAPRIEIIHESLLSSWPRLVRWQTQDTEGAQLRDELRQAAQMWAQHSHSEDFLWTGTAFNEFQLWRERYPGGLTTEEEEFARAMTTHAERRKRRRRTALAVVVSGLLVVLAIVTWSRFEAVAEARRAQAANLLALGQLRLEDDPSEAMAYTIASLEFADSEAARVFAARTRWADAPMLVLNPERGGNLVVPRFSPDGRWLSLAGAGRTDVLVWRQDGSGPVVLGGHSASSSGAIRTAWTSENELVTGHWTEGRVRIWSFPGGDLVREIDFGAQAHWRIGGEHLFAEVVETDAESGHEIVHLRSWRLSDDRPVELGTFDRTALGSSDSGFDPDGSDWIYTKGSEIFCRPLPVRDGVPDRLIGSNENEPWIVWHLVEPDRLWTVDSVTGESRLWDLSASSGQPLQVLASLPGVEEGMFVVPSADGRWLHDLTSARDGKALLWDPLSVPGANPRELRRSGSWYGSRLDVHPDGDWIAASTDSLTKVSFWPLRSQMPTVVSGYDTFAFRPVVFTPDGEWLATYWNQDKVRLWPLPGSASRQTRDLEIEASNKTHTWLAIDSAGERLFVTGYGQGLFVLSLDAGEPRRLDGFAATTFVQQGAFSPSGRLAAAAASFASEERELHVWDLESGENKTFELPRAVNEPEGEPIVQDLAFMDESTLLTAGENGVLRWDLDSGTHEQLVGVAKPGQRNRLWLSGDRQQLITGVGDEAGECGPLVLHDLAAGQSRELETFVRCGEMQWVEGVVFDDTLSVMAVAGDDGIVRVGRVGSGSPHLLTGHGGPIRGVAISPDGRWIASSGEDNTLRLWPMPDLDHPPLHTVPLDELLKKLRSMTNIRVVRDPESAEGWKVTLDAFPGWEEVLTW